MIEQRNPFLESLVLEVRHIKAKEKAFNLVNDDNVNLPIEKFAYDRNREVEIDRSVKVYIIDNFEKVIPHLKVNSLRIWLYIERHIPPKKDYIELKAKYFKDTYDISTATYYNAINELTIANLIIKRKDRKNTFWINIKYVFNGNRIDFVRNIDKDKIKYI